MVGEKGASVELDSDKENEENKVDNRYPATFYILLPIAGLIFLLFRQNIFNKLLLQLDRRCLSVFCPSLSQREQLLKWACNRLPLTWSSNSKTLAGGVAELWADGSLLCTLINTAIPGACPNPHRHWNKPPTHAQAIAYKYLAVIPIFTEKDLSGPLTSKLERNFLIYLNELQRAISKLADKDDSIKRYSSAYIPRGMGLFSGEQHRKTIFYVYANPEHGVCNTNTIIQIRGPYGTYGQAIIPKFQNKLFAVPDVTIISDSMTSKKFTRSSKSIKFLENFPFSFMKYHKKHLGDNIIIDVSIEKDRAKITYIPKNYGMYDINMISNGELLKGCPYHVHIFNNTSGIEDNFEEEDKAEIIPKYRKRKVLSKTIDLIDNSLPLSEFHEKFQNQINPTREILTKPTFNFREVVEEIARNSNILKNLIPEEKFDGDNEEKLLSIQGKEVDLVELTTHIEGDQLLEDKNIKNILEISPIPEVEEKELLVSTENGNFQEHVFEKHNLESVTENDVIKSQNTSTLNITKQICEANESILDNMNKSEFNGVAQNDSNVLSLVDAYDNRIIANKIQIPEKFSEQLRKTLVNELSSKHYKNALNNCTKPNKNSYQCADFNNNVKKGFYNVEDSETRSKQIIPTLDLFDSANPNFSSNTQHTSPICLDHIESEVDYERLSVAEKRKIFSQGALPSLHESSNNSFSENEGSTSSTSIKNYNFEGLSVLNVLKTLKQSQSISNIESYSLSGTKSLPDISLNSEYNSYNSVKLKKHFWETLISSSSLNITRSSSMISSSPYRHGKPLSQIERDKQIWKRPDEQTNHQVYMDKSSEIHKSADDILSMADMFQYQQPKKYKSMDTSLDTCTILSIEERKKILLKQNYEKEKMEKKYFSAEFISCKKWDGTENRTTTANGNSSIRDKIRKYNSVANLSFIEEEKYENDPKIRTVSYPQSHVEEPAEKYTFRSQFKRAVKYFRNLERQSTGKTKSKTIKKTNRKLSLDLSQKKTAQRKGGSLNLTNVSENFSVCNLYEDVNGSRTGSFKGTPNRKALLEALATFSHDENKLYQAVDNDDIEFEIFKKRAKMKKRKSVKSIFNLYY